MRYFLFLVAIFNFEIALAKTSIELYPLNIQSRWEQSETQQLEPRSALNFAFGGSRFGWGLMFEFSKYDVVSGGEFSSIHRTHEEFLVWGKREFFRKDNVFTLFGIGSGFARENVDTRFGGESVIDPSQTDVIYGLMGSAGVEIQKVIRLSIEGRFISGSSADPSVQPDLVVRTGLTF